MSAREEELRRLAQAATPGPWGNTDVSDPTRINSPYDQVAICYRTSRAITNAKFIATANPATVIELLDEIERLRAVFEAARRVLKNPGCYQPMTMLHKAVQAALLADQGGE